MVQIWACGCRLTGKAKVLEVDSAPPVEFPIDWHIDGLYM